MEVKSLKGLEETVERAEDVLQRLKGLDQRNGGVRVPILPVPITIETISEWLEDAEECCRKPRVAESKQLLLEKGISVVSIPLKVLNEPESLRALLDKINRLPDALHESAVGAVGRALTKGLDDAQEAVEIYSAAARQLEVVRSNEQRPAWVYTVIIRAAAESPGDAPHLVEQANGLYQLLDAAKAYGVVVEPCESLAEACGRVREFLTAVRGYASLVAAEGLEDNVRTSLRNKPIVAATECVQQATSEIAIEKNQLQERIQALIKQLVRVGGKSRVHATSVAELRKEFQDLSGDLKARRQLLLSSLGQDVYEVVETLLDGEVSPAERVPDDALGRALRKALECGYRLRLEAPLEDC